VVNRVYNFIKEDKTLSKDIKVIGIGLESQPNDLEVYKKTYKIEFPFFSDPDKVIYEAVKGKLKFVPMLVLMEKNGKVLMSHLGLIENFDTLLAEIRKIHKGQ
jgi:hypothetical protein